MRLAFVVLAGCYGAAPPKPALVPLPALARAEIAVQAEQHTVMEDIQHEATSCPSGKGPGDPACSVTRYTVSEPRTHVTTTATYGGEPITYAQFRVLTDPERDRKLARLDELSHDCRRANIPRYLGYALVTAGVIGAMAGAGGETNTNIIVLYGGLGAGLATLGLGYAAFGGRKCNDARELYDQLDLSTATSVDGADQAAEMKELAARFNARTKSLAHAAQ